jgi:integrase
MPRTVRDTNLSTRTTRLKLKARAKPYYRGLDHGLHLGYRRGRDGGRWVIRVYIGQENYKVETIANADDIADADGVAVLSFYQAQEKARARRAELVRESEGLPAQQGPYTVAIAIDEYITSLEQEGRSDRTVRDTRKAMDLHVVPKLGEIRLDRLTTAQIKSWLSAMAKTAPRVRTKAGKKQRHRTVDMKDDEVRRKRQAAANRILTYFKAALNLAWRNNRVASDKAWRAVQPFKGADASRARYLQIDECRRLIATCTDAEFRDLLESGLHTGARYSELGRLEPTDFNADVGTLAVRRSKSGKPRHIHLTEEGEAYFAALAKRASNRNFLLVQANGEPWKTSQQHRPMKAACAAAGIKPAGFHVLRHTWASHSVMNGVPLFVVADNLGHKDTRMVERHYGHLAPSYKADAIRAGAPRFGFEADGR